MLRPKPTRDTAATGGAHRHSGLRHPEGDLGKGRPLDAARAGQLEERMQLILVPVTTPKMGLVIPLVAKVTQAWAKANVDCSDQSLTIKPSTGVHVTRALSDRRTIMP